MPVKDDDLWGGPPPTPAPVEHTSGYLREVPDPLPEVPAAAPAKRRMIVHYLDHGMTPCSYGFEQDDATIADGILTVKKNGVMQIKIRTWSHITPDPRQGWERSREEPKSTVTSEGIL